MTSRRFLTSSALVLAGAALCAPGPASAATGTLLFAPTYAKASLGVTSVTSWTGEQEAAADRLQIVTGSAVLGGAGKPAGALRARIAPGDQTKTGDYSARRSEVLYSGARGNGEEVWIDFSLYIPTSTPLSGPASPNWSDVFQWKGQNGSSPAVAIGLKPSTGHLYVDGGANISTLDLDLGAVKRGTWQRITLGVKFSTSATSGWVEGYLGGVNTIPRRARQTLEVLSGVADKVYAKQGLYEGSGWNRYDRVVYHSPIRIATTKAVAIG